MKKPPKLPEAELDVMLALWSFSQPVRTARILEALQARRTWTASTLKVVLGRLVEKGFVEETRQGRFTLYRALVPEEEYRRSETRHMLGRFYGNSVKNLVAAPVQDEGLSQAELAELEDILRRAGGKQ